MGQRNSSSIRSSPKKVQYDAQTFQRSSLCRAGIALRAPAPEPKVPTVGVARQLLGHVRFPIPINGSVCSAAGFAAGVCEELAARCAPLLAFWRYPSNHSAAQNYQSTSLSDDAGFGKVPLGGICAPFCPAPVGRTHPGKGVRHLGLGALRFLTIC